MPSPVFLSVTCVYLSFRVSNSVTDITCQIVCTLTVRFIEPLYGHGHEYLAATLVLCHLMSYIIRIVKRCVFGGYLKSVLLSIILK